MTPLLIDPITSVALLSEALILRRGECSLAVAAIFAVLASEILALGMITLAAGVISAVLASEILILGKVELLLVSDVVFSSLCTATLGTELPVLTSLTPTCRRVDQIETTAAFSIRLVPEISIHPFSVL